METKIYQTTTNPSAETSNETVTEKIQEAVNALRKEKGDWERIQRAALTLPQDNPETRTILQLCAEQQQRLDDLIRMLDKK